MSSPHPREASSPLIDENAGLFDCLASTQGVPQFQFLLQSGADPNICDLTGISLLTRAVLTEQFNFVQLLLEYETDPLFVYDPSIYHQWQRYNTDTPTTNTTTQSDSVIFNNGENNNNNNNNEKNDTKNDAKNDIKNNTNPSPAVSTKSYNDTNLPLSGKSLTTSISPQPIQIPITELEPLPFIACHFKTRKIFDALIKSLTFDEVLLLRNSSGQSIFEYAAYNCPEHMIMDSLLRYLKGRMDKFTRDNILFMKPAIPQQFWPSTLTGIPEPKVTSLRNSDDKPVSPALIRYLVSTFMHHAIINGISVFVTLYLLYNADPNGCINDYSTGVMFIPTTQSIQELKAIQMLIVTEHDFDLAQFPHVRYLRWLVGRHHHIYNTFGSNLNPQIELEAIPLYVENDLFVSFKFEPYIIVAAQSGYDDIIFQLIDEGADVNAVSNKANGLYNDEFLNVLSVAFFQGHLQLCRKLIFYQDEKNEKNEKNNQNNQNGKNNNNNSSSSNLLNNKPNQSPGQSKATLGNNTNDNDGNSVNTSDNNINKINTSQLDALLTNQIKRYIDPINLSRVDQFITFRFQQYLQEQRDNHQLRLQQQHQPSRLKGFFKGIVDSTKAAIHDLTDHPQGNNIPNQQYNTPQSNIVIGNNVISPVADLIAFNNATQLIPTSDHQAQSSIINTVLPLPHHIKSLSQLLLAKPTKETLKNNSSNIEFCRRIYLEPLLIHFCDTNDHIMIESLLKLSLHRRHLILKIQKRQKIKDNVENLQKSLVKRCVLPLQQHTVEDEINVDDDNDVGALPEQDEFELDDISPLETTPIGTQSNPQRRSSALPHDINNTNTNNTTPTQNTTNLQNNNKKQDSFSHHSASSLTAADFALSNPQLVNARNPHNEYRPMHYAILRLDLELTKLLLKYKPQLLRAPLQTTPQTLNQSSHSMYPLDFAHHIQTQLRSDLNDEIQAQYLAKLVELGLAPQSVLTGRIPSPRSVPGMVLASPRGGILGGAAGQALGMQNNQNNNNNINNNQNFANNNNNIVQPSPMNRSTPAFQRATAFPSNGDNTNIIGINNNNQHGQNLSNNNNQNENLSNGNVNLKNNQNLNSPSNSLLKPNLNIYVDWDIVDGELDMGEDDFTPLDDDFTTSSSLVNSTGPPNQNFQKNNQNASTQKNAPNSTSFRQAFAAAKSSQATNQPPSFPVGKFGSAGTPGSGQNNQNLTSKNNQNNQNNQIFDTKNNNPYQLSPHKSSNTTTPTTQLVPTSTQSTLSDSTPTHSSTHSHSTSPTHSGLNAPGIDLQQSFDLISDLSQINYAMGVHNQSTNGSNSNINNRLNGSGKQDKYTELKINSMTKVSSNIENDFTLVEPIIEMESPTPSPRAAAAKGSNTTMNGRTNSTGSNSNDNKSNINAPGRPSRPTRPGRPTIASNTAPGLGPINLNKLPESSNSTNNTNTNKVIVSKPQSMLTTLSIVDSDDEDDIDFKNKNNINTKKSTVNFSIEIGVLLNFLHKKDKERRHQAALASQLQKECDMSNHAAFFGLSTNTTNSTLQSNGNNDVQGNIAAINTNNNGNNTSQNKKNNQNNQKGINSSTERPFGKLIKLLPPSFSIGPNQRMQYEFLSTFLVPTPQMTEILTKISKLASIIDLLSYFVSVLIVPLQDNTKSNLDNIDELLVPLESSISRYGGLGFNPTNQNTKKLLEIEHPLHNQTKIVPSLVDYYRHKRSIAKMRLLERKEKRNGERIQKRSRSSNNNDNDDGSNPPSPHNTTDLSSFLSDDSDDSDSDSTENDDLCGKDGQQYPQHQSLTRRNSHFEALAQSMNQDNINNNNMNGLQEDNNNNNNNDSAANALLKEKIDGSSKKHKNNTTNNNNNTNVMSTNRDHLNELTSLTRGRGHRTRRVDISLAELSGHSNANSTTSAKQKKSQRTLFNSDDDDNNEGGLDTKYEFSFEEKHRLMLIQLTNEQLNKEDDDLMALFTKRAKEYELWKQQLINNKGGDFFSTLKLTKLQQLIENYLQNERYPDFYDDFIDIDLKTASITCPINDNNNNQMSSSSLDSSSQLPDVVVSPRTLRPSSLQMQPSASSINSLNSTNTSSSNDNNKNKKKLRWVDLQY